MLPRMTASVTRSQQPADGVDEQPVGLVLAAYYSKASWIQPCDGRYCANVACGTGPTMGDARRRALRALQRAGVPRGGQPQTKGMDEDGYRECTTAERLNILAGLF